MLPHSQHVSMTLCYVLYRTFFASHNILQPHLILKTYDIKVVGEGYHEFME
jgi:hypothetical protein